MEHCICKTHLPLLHYLSCKIKFNSSLKYTTDQLILLKMWHRWQIHFAKQREVREMNLFLRLFPHVEENISFLLAPSDGWTDFYTLPHYKFPSVILLFTFFFIRKMCYMYAILTYYMPNSFIKFWKTFTMLSSKEFFAIFFTIVNISGITIVKNLKFENKNILSILFNTNIFIYTSQISIACLLPNLCWARDHIY